MKKLKIVATPGRKTAEIRNYSFLKALKADALMFTIKKFYLFHSKFNSISCDIILIYKISLDVFLWVLMYFILHSM